MPDLTEQFYPEWRFGGFTESDGTVAFYGRLAAMLEPHFTVVDFGCGPGTHQSDPGRYRRDLRRIKGRVARVIGIDVDPSYANNASIDEFKALEQGGEWPLPAESADVVLCDAVMEHLAGPDQFFAESRRVLRSGGLLAIRTTNVFSYVGLAARLIPDRRHARVVQRAQSYRSSEEFYPTFYRCNTVWKLRRQLKNHGFDGVAYGHESEPRYLAFGRVPYALGVLHQKLSLSCMKPTLFAFARRVS